MNSNLNAQASRLEKQEQKLQSLWMDCDYYDDYEHYDDACMSEQSEQAPSLSDGKKSTGGGIFSSLLNKFQQENAVDGEVNNDLAHFVNTTFRSGLTKDIHRPQYCEALVKTRVNQETGDCLRCIHRLMTIACR